MLLAPLPGALGTLVMTTSLTALLCARLPLTGESKQVSYHSRSRSFLSLAASAKLRRGSPLVMVVFITFEGYSPLWFVARRGGSSLLDFVALRGTRSTAGSSLGGAMSAGVTLLDARK